MFFEVPVIKLLKSISLSLTHTLTHSVTKDTHEEGREKEKKSSGQAAVVLGKFY